MTDTAEKLLPLPCPFCGVKAHHDEEHNEYTCNDRQYPGKSVTVSIEHWNRRAPSAPSAGEPVAVVRRSMTGGNAGLSRHVEITADFILNDGELLYTHPPAQRDGAAVAELKNIVNAKRFDVDVFEGDTQFADWAQSRARFTISAIDAAIASGAGEQTTEKEKV